MYLRYCLIILWTCLGYNSAIAAAGDDTLFCRTQVVFTEDFGAGETNPGQPLPGGSITYCYENLAGSCPSNPGITVGSIDDGGYSIMNDPVSGLIFANGDTTAWLSIDDHTPDDTNGYMLVVNASFEPGEFFRLDNIPVIQGEPYEFRAWFANILSQVSLDNCGQSEVPVNVNFIVEDASSGAQLGALSTGDIFGTGTANWVETEFLFTASSPSINVVLVNNAPGGCGNDFAIDDISLTGCIANTTTANEDFFSGCDANGIIGNILTNDTDDQGDEQIISSVWVDLDGDQLVDTSISLSQAVSVGGLSDSLGPIPEIGTLLVEPNGNITLNHAPLNLPGNVYLEYVICDNGIPVICDTAAVNIQINCDPNTTQAVDDSYTGCSPSSLAGNLLANDLDVENDQQQITGILFDLDGDLIPETIGAIGTTLQVGGNTDQSGPTEAVGILTVNENGSFEFNYDTLNVSGQVVFDYIIQDNGTPVFTDTANVILNLNCQPGDTSGCRDQVIFLEDFGSGSTNPGAELPPGTTTYCYEDLTGTCPVPPEITPGSINDGSYSILNDPVFGLLSSVDSSAGWISIDDHSPGDVDGYMLVINADFEPGEFYRKNGIEVIPGEPYDFSAWFNNIQPVPSGCGTLQVPVNVRFRVENAMTGAELGSISTGDIYATVSNDWIEKSFFFIATASRINIVLENNAAGGCGNDFAIDDVRLTGCIANTTEANIDFYANCVSAGITGNLLDNDIDAQGDSQMITAIRVDTDGDLVVDTEVEPGTMISVGGLSDEFGDFPDIGTLQVDGNGDFIFIHEPLNLPGIISFEYTVCDDGLPVICDTGSVAIRINCEVVDTLGCRTEVVFVEDFGAGLNNPGAELPTGATTYCFEDLSGTCPSDPFLTPGSINDGSYSVMNDPFTGIIYAAGDTSAWISTQDHTPDDTSGYMLVVNADFDPGEFYRLDDIAVVTGEPYTFSAWFINILSEVSLDICQDDEVPVNVEFRVEDAQTNALLGSINTGDIYATGNSDWVRREFLFTATSPLINIVLVNNAPGGCGNDFAIDDISLIGCIANTTTAVDDLFAGCETTGITGNVLSNDVDDFNDDQLVTGLFIDTDGDLIVDTEVTVGNTVMVGGLSDAQGPLSEMGQLNLQPDGSLTLIHEPINLAGQIVAAYIICDSGIPMACDTATIIINITCVPPDTLGCRTEVVFTEDFGAGQINPGPALPNGSITYCFEDLTGTCPSNPGITAGSIDDGSYSILNNPKPGLIFLPSDTIAWLEMEDHTPDDTSGYMLVVNASFEPGEFYRLNDIPVVEGEPYEFSAWFANILTPESILNCSGQEVPVNVNFIVEDAATSTVLGALSTGDIFGTGAELWVRTEFLFEATSPFINVVLINNSPGGCGNDFAIDDISLTGCIANTTTAVDDNVVGCEDAGLQGNLLSNDRDEQGDDQFILTYFYDADGDGILESESFPGSATTLVGTSSSGNLIDPFAILTVNSDGSFMLDHVDNANGSTTITYIVCDDGIPEICDTATVSFTVNCEILPCDIPNFLSPNGDGLNDFFEIPCAPEFEDFELLIYNRWGNMVYKSNMGYDNDWAGTWAKNGEPLPDGTYFYIIRFNDDEGTEYAGDVLLLR